MLAYLTEAYTHMYHTGSILRNQALPAAGQHVPGLKFNYLIATTQLISVVTYVAIRFYK